MAPAGTTTANSSTRAGSQYITDTHPATPAQIAVPIAGHRLLAKREEEMLIARQDPSKRRSRYAKELPAETFLLWRQRQCKKLKDRIVFPSDYLCAICLSEMAEEDIIRGLPCNHCFHQECLDPWFRRYHYNCPLCKTQFFSPCGQGRGTLGDTRTRPSATTPPTPSQPSEIAAVFIP